MDTLKIGIKALKMHKNTLMGFMPIVERFIKVFFVWEFKI